MTIEPHNVVTVSRRALPQLGATPDDYAKSAAAYAANLRDRFGKLPSWPELAKRENAARLKQHPVSTMARPQVPQPIHPNSKAAVEAILAKGEATRQSILDVLTKPMTCPDVAYALGRTRQLINRHLVILAGQGDVVGRKVKGIVVWERRKEAAE